MIPDHVQKQIDEAREGVERSRRIAQSWPTTARDNGRLQDEVKELRLAVDRLVYAVELLAHGD